MSAERLEFDHRIITAMSASSDLLSFQAFATISDLRAGKIDHGNAPGAYKVTFNIPTLIGEGGKDGKGQFAQETSMAIDLRTVGYPIQPPNVTVLSEIPYSPHFRQNSPVCIGPEAWAQRAGHVTLGHLIVHLSKLLNWDEEMRGGGYQGWNGAAIAFHKRVYGERPLNEAIVYPALPSFLTGKTKGFQPRASKGGFSAKATHSGFQPHPRSEPDGSAFRPR